MSTDLQLRLRDERRGEAQVAVVHRRRVCVRRLALQHQLARALRAPLFFFRRAARLRAQRVELLAQLRLRRAVAPHLAVELRAMLLGCERDAGGAPLGERRGGG